MFVLTLQVMPLDSSVLVHCKILSRLDPIVTVQLGESVICFYFLSIIYRIVIA